MITTGTLPLDTQRQGWVDDAWQAVDRSTLRDLVAEMTEIPSPTGREGRLARFLVERMRRAGLTANLQALDDDRANAVGWLGESGDGPDLLLYAPIDTHLDADDARWLPSDRPDLEPHASVDGDVVVGLGAENPKAFGACLVVAAEAIRRAGVPLTGALRVGLGAGGMPTNRLLPDGRANIGHGVGASFMIERGFRGDFAICAKPGWAVSWEEVGLAWFRIETRGTFNYTGIRHIRPYRNPIVSMARVVDWLETWFPRYTEANRSGLVAPQGSIGAIVGGWEDKPAFVPARCELLVDLRVSPRTEIADVERQLRAGLAELTTNEPDLDLGVDLVLAVPGSHTPPESWIVRSAIRSWEAVAGRPHVPPSNTSGATDANILRARGIPTARIGLPPVAGLPYSDGFSMGAVDAAAMVELTRLLVHAIVDTCTRRRSELGA